MATRVVLLGASNLTLGLSTVLRTARSTLGPGPMQVFVAAGHGRSYGQWSRVLFRGLPGILQCGLWAAAAKATGAGMYALVTDIGNDLAYGTSPGDLARWVGVCLDRLGEIGANTALTLLPAPSLSRLPPWQYHLFKALLYPGRGLPFVALQDRVAEVNERLMDLASRRRVTLVEPKARWYGADAIHIRRSQRAAAWAEILSGWERPSDQAPAPPPASSRLACRGLRPERRTLFGIRLRRPQPSGVFPDGTVVSLF